jgi:acyl-CoA synthetase (NDP forming)
VLASSNALDALFAPRSVAVIGASRRPTSVGGALLANILRGGFTGPVYPVNRKADTVQSVKAYASLSCVPGPVDLAVVVTPSREVSSVIDACVAKAVRAVVLVSAGFAERDGEGTVTQAHIAERCRAAGIALIGPNCLGVLSASSRLNATFALSAPPAGGVAVCSQSGAVLAAVVDAAAQRDVGMGEAASIGNSAGVGFSDLLGRWRTDEATRVALLYIESLTQPRAFLDAARRTSRQKPIIAIKAGRTSSGARAAASHTAALASPESAVTALMRQAGIIRVDNVTAMMDTAALLDACPPLHGRKIAIITNAGGFGIMAADTCEAARLTLPQPLGSVATALRDQLARDDGIANPLDLGAAASAEDYAIALRVLNASDAYDAVLVVCVPTAVTDVVGIAEQIAAVAEKGTKPIVACVLGAQTTPPVLNVLRAHVPTFALPEDAVRALANAAGYVAWRSRGYAEPPAFADVDRAAVRSVLHKARGRLQSASVAARDAWLTPPETGLLLAAYGIACVETRMVASPEEAVAAAEKLGFPVALKLVARAVVHKSDVGGVVLGLRDKAAVAEEATALYRRFSGQIEGLVVQPMHDRGPELFAGFTRDPAFGPLVAFGVGGIGIEVTRDVVCGLAPLSQCDAEDLVAGIRARAVLDGYRGQPGVDRSALIDMLMRVANMAASEGDLVELDINPLRCDADRRPIALDVRVRMRID